MKISDNEITFTKDELFAILTCEFYKILEEDKIDKEKYATEDELNDIVEAIIDLPNYTKNKDVNELDSKSKKLEKVYEAVLERIVNEIKDINDIDVARNNLKKISEDLERISSPTKKRKV